MVDAVSNQPPAAVQQDRKAQRLRVCLVPERDDIKGAVVVEVPCCERGLVIVAPDPVGSRPRKGRWLNLRRPWGGPAATCC